MKQFEKKVMNEINKWLEFERVLSAKGYGKVASHLQAFSQRDKIKIMPKTVVENLVEKEKAKQNKSKKN